jgi:hypothetical protein
MRPLTVDDLLPLGEFAGRRREFFESMNRYLDRYRRVRVGPRAMLVFENRQTLWFRAQEVFRVARLADPDRLRHELNLFNRLLPGRNRLQAALLIDLQDDSRWTEELAFWSRLTGNELSFCLGEKRYAAHLVTCRPEDRTTGATHWVQFELDQDGRELLPDLRQSAYLEISHQSYVHQSSLLSDEVRQSLIDDLVLSDRDQ